MTASLSPESLADADFITITDDDVAAQSQGDASLSWPILVIDDDPEVHSATRFALGQQMIVGRPPRLLSAYSAEEGKALLEQNPDVAVVLLDVVMEAHDAGLRFAEWMRAKGYQKQRIILRTGQPGYAPELEVIRDYDINDYREKGELTRTRLVTAVTAAVRTFEQFWITEEQRFELESFSYALAHDFKQTTRQIKTFSDLIAETYPADAHSDGPKMLAYLGSAARRLGALVDVLSQYSLLNRPCKTQPVDLELVLAEVREALSPVLEQTGGRLTMDGAGTCYGNPVLLAQVLQILIANGLQHNDSPVPAVDVTVTLKASSCLIAVRDNGVGIDPKDLSYIFEPRARLRASAELPGTGLGLTLSRRAVEAQGGTITCEPLSGSGSMFCVTLPVGTVAA